MIVESVGRTVLGVGHEADEVAVTQQQAVGQVRGSGAKALHPGRTRRSRMRRRDEEGAQNECADDGDDDEAGEFDDSEHGGELP